MVGLVAVLMPGCACGAGHTVEMHGSINQLVCSECSAVAAMTPASLKSLRAKRGIPCRACEAASVRMRIMLYDDAEGAHCWRHGVRLQ